MPYFIQKIKVRKIKVLSAAILLGALSLKMPHSANSIYKILCNMVMWSGLSMLFHTKEQYFEHLGIKTKLFTHFSFQVIDHLQMTIMKQTTMTTLSLWLKFLRIKMYDLS